MNDVTLREDERKWKWKCQQCGHVSTQYLTARSPFDDDQLVACAKCKSVGTLVGACHFEGCCKESSNGMKNSKGEYVWSCHEHSPERTGE